MATVTPQDRMRTAAQVWELSYTHARSVARRCGEADAEPSAETLFALRRELREHQARTGDLLRGLDFLPSFNQEDMHNLSRAFRGLPKGKAPAPGPVEGGPG